MSENPAPAPPAKVDPETLAIRAGQPRAIRFKRGVIVAIAALGSTSLVAVAWVALRPHVFHVVADAPDLFRPGEPTATDTLNGLPKSYGDVPKLGPPLPGDLGRPILDHERVMATEDGTGSDPAKQAAVEERERRLAEIKAARESAVLVKGGAAPVDVSAEISPSSSPVAEPEVAAMATVSDPNGQGEKAHFIAATDKSSDTNPHRLTAPPSPYLLSAGSVIAASPITGLRSDLPGLVIAQVTSAIYDSPTGRILLVPQGARLIGNYDSVVAFGQRRALIVWQRILLPDGSSLDIDNVPATDPSGYAGLEDKIDRHTFELLKGVGIATLLGVGSELSFNGQGDLVQAVRESTQQNVSRAGDQLTSRSLDIQPTITIRPGAIVRLVVRKDLVLAPWPRAD